MLSLLPSLSLLQWVQALWVALCSAVVVSPLFEFLTEAGSYGKLRHNGYHNNEVQNKDSDEDEDEHKSKGKLRPPQKQQQKHDQSKSKSGFRGAFLHSVLHIRTSVAFVAYYALAGALNAWMLGEAVIVLQTGRIPSVLSFLRWVSSARLGERKVGSMHLHLSESEVFRLGLVVFQLALFQVHLLRRLWECVAVSRFSAASSQHLMVFLFGMLYYVLCTLTPVLDSPIMDEPAHGLLPSAEAKAWPVLPVLGTVVFGTGFWLQHVQHRILAQLRTQKKHADSASSSSSSKASTAAAADKPNHRSKEGSSDQSSRYSIPYGSLFRFVSMPHYLCEMVEYTGLWMISGMKFSQFLVCIWVYSNLSITGVRSHRWYQRTFPNYPRERKAVIPFLL